MSSSEGSELTALGVHEALRRVPAMVAVVEARSRRIVYANARVREMSEKELGRSLPLVLTGEWEIFHPDGRPYRVEEWPVVRSITTGEEIVDDEYFHVRPDGSRLIVRCSSSPVYGEDGQIVAGVQVMSDITQERRAEEQIAYHAKLADIVEDAVVGMDAEFRVTVWNRGAERLYGYAAVEVLGRDARDVASYTGDTSRTQLERELLRTDRGRSEITASRKDGTPVDVEQIVVAVRGELGEITGYLGIHRDVTDRKRAEAALHASRRQIEMALESITDSFIAVHRQKRFTYDDDRALRRLRRTCGAVTRRWFRR
jgi:PAS domain S-box-containing protein